MFFFYLWSLISLNLSGPIYTTAVICSVIILYAHHGQSKCLNVWKQSPNIQFQIFFFTPGSIWCQSEWISLIWWSQAHGFICEHNSSAHLLFTPFYKGKPIISKLPLGGGRANTAAANGEWTEEVHQGSVVYRMEEYKHKTERQLNILPLKWCSLTVKFILKCSRK